MTIAVMQPYIFPYLGYYQLAAAVDKFVFFDDVNFINKGWINRNRILGHPEPYKFTVPLNKASQNRRINEIELADYDKWKAEFVKLLTHTYKKAPQFAFVMDWLQQFFNKAEYRLISELAAASVTAVSQLLGQETAFLLSSDLPYRVEGVAGGQEKILGICGLLDATSYVNPRNGMDMYDEASFAMKNIQLRFISMEDVIYDQLGKDHFQPGLSILDVLMFNEPEQIKTLLQRYQLTSKQEAI